METSYARKRVGDANLYAGGVRQRAVAGASQVTSIARVCDGRIKGVEDVARESERLVRLGTMADVFAHEIANPLNGISLTLECVKRALESGNFDSGRLIATLQGTMLEVDRLGSLLSEFRDLGGSQPIEFTKTDLEKNIKELMACQYAVCREHKIAVKVQFENPLPPVMAHANKIKEVVLNLCKNAVEAMPDGGVLTVKGYRCTPMVVLEISDTGFGIDPGLDVFDLHRTTKRNGSGIGLPLVWQIVSAHNGTIDCTSVSGPAPRTIFTISLPAATE